MIEARGRGARVGRMKRQEGNRRIDRPMSDTTHITIWKKRGSNAGHLRKGRRVITTCDRGHGDRTGRRSFGKRPGGGESSSARVPKGGGKNTAEKETRSQPAHPRPLGVPQGGDTYSIILVRGKGKYYEAVSRVPEGEAAEVSIPELALEHWVG